MAGLDYIAERGLDAQAGTWTGESSLYAHPRRPVGSWERAALLVLDVQRFFLDPASHAFLPAAVHVLPRIQEAIRRLPRAFFTRHALEPGEDPGRMGDWWGSVVTGDAGDGALALSPGSRPVIRKIRYSAFRGTDLEARLRDEGCDTVVLCGVMTHLCVETTARDAFQAGFHVVVLADATAAPTEDLHLGALRSLAHGFATILRVSDLGPDLACRGGPGAPSPALPAGAQVAVVGAGPAGLLAASQLARQDRSVVLLERSEPGGLLLLADRVENGPGHPPLSGPLLASRLLARARALGVTPVEARVQDLAWDGRWSLSTSQGTLSADAVVLATGTAPVPAGLPGEELEGVFQSVRDLLRAAPPPGPVWVIGGGDGAFDQACTLARRGREVHVAVRGAAPRALPLLLRRARSLGVQVHTGFSPGALAREGGLLRLQAGPQAVAVLVAVGRVPVEPPLRAPSDAPLWRVGDLVRGRHRQVAMAAGDGVEAAMKIEEWFGRRSP